MNNGSAEDDLREVAATLSRTGKILGQGLEQANLRGQRLRGAISRLERSSEWSLAERRRAEDEIKGFFEDIREAIRVKEEELLRDAKGVYDLQDEGNKRRLEELVQQGQRLSKACQGIQGLQDGSVKATIDSLNPPLNQLLEALESSSATLHREETLQESEAAELGNDEVKGVKFFLCPDRVILDQVSQVNLCKFDSTSPTVVFVGTPDAVEEQSRKRNVYKSTKVPLKVEDTSFLEDATPQKIGSPSSTSSKFEASRFTSSPRRNGNDISRSNINARSNIKAVVPFEGEEEKGVLFYFGTKAGRSLDFANPALFSPDDPYLVVLRASSRIEGDLASLVGNTHHEGTFFETDSLLSSWVSVELPLPLAPSHYSLGYFINGQDHVPRNWVLQASKDNLSWTTLKVHENDSSLNNEMHLATWRISDQANANSPYRYFKITQTGPSSSGTLFLVLSLIEFYGTLYDEK